MIVLDFNEYNSILYQEISQYVRMKGQRIDKALFICILSACRLVYLENSIKYACGIAGIGASSIHYDAKEISKYVKPIMKIALPVLKEKEKSLLSRDD